VDPIIISLGTGIVGTVGKTGMAELVPDTAADDRYIPDVFGGKSELTVPIVFQGAVLGVLDSENSRTGGFSRQDLRLLQSAATVLSPRIAWASEKRDRVHAEAALKHALDEWYPQFNRNPVARVSVDGTVLYANQAAQDCFGTADWSVGGELPVSWWEKVTDAITSGMSRRTEVRVGARTFAVDLVPFADAGFVTLYGLDITDRIVAEDLLQRSEEQYSKLFRLSSDGIVIHDFDGNIIKVNERAQQLFGYEEGEFLALRADRLQPPHAPVRVLEEARRSSSDNYETRFLTKDGVSFPAEVSPALYTVAGRPTVQLFIRDTTERAAAEQELRRSEEKYRAILASIEDGYYEVDLRGDLRFANEALAHVLGYASTAMLGRNYREIMHGDDADRLYTAFNEVYRTGAPSKGIRWMILTQDGEQRWMEGSVSLLRDEQNRPTGFRGIIRDVSSRETTARRLAEAREQEIAIGAEIQEKFLHGTPPSGLAGAELAAVALPSQRMAGDFVDFFTHHGRYLDVLVGDMMGKGIPAALLGATVKSQFVRARGVMGFPGDTSPAEIVGAVHRALTPRLIELETFATACYVRLDLMKQRLRFVSCGHPPILHYRAETGECLPVTGGNLPLGFLVGHVYEEHVLDFGPGDAFLVHSDGLTEARAPDGSLFGLPRVLDLIRAHAALGPDELLTRIRSDVHEFTGTEQYADDLTIVVIHAGPPTAEFRGCRLARSFASSTDQLEHVRGFIAEFCGTLAAAVGLDLTPLFVTQLQLAVQEAVTNIIRHGISDPDDAEVHITAEAHTDRVVVLLSHKGQTYHPDRIAPPDLTQYPEGGFGLYLMANTVDALIYPDRDEGVSCVGVVKFLP
jgi:PAS domain S-box-containing protein